MKPRRKKPGPSECRLTGEEAQAAFERTLGAPQDGGPQAKDLAEHIAGCEPCSSALHALELQGDAVAELARGAGGAGAGGTAVETILRVAARSGSARFADLAYELAKACLIQLPNLERRVRRVVEPREAKLVARELRTAHQRSGPGAHAADLKGVPDAAPAESEALRAAASCLRILENVEGASPRQVLGMSQVHIFEQKPEQAEKLLRELMEQPITPQMRQYARSNLMLALVRQAKYIDVVRIGDDALRQGPDEWAVLFNLAVAHAHLRHAEPFKTVAKRLGSLAVRSDSAYLSTLVQFEIPRLAEDLGSPLPDVERAFGMQRGARSR
jgi:hypothetical protein